MYQNINPKIEKKIQEIINGNYEFSLLGTIGKENFPSISKILPMMNNNVLYVLLSDLSEHTQNINNNNKVSFSCGYFMRVRPRSGMGYGPHSYGAARPRARDSATLAARLRLRAMHTHTHHATRFALRSPAPARAASTPDALGCRRLSHSLGHTHCTLRLYSILIHVRCIGLGRCLRGRE